MLNQNNGEVVESPLNLKEAAEFLRIKPGTLYQWCCKKIIPYYKMNGGRLLFKLEDLKNFAFSEKNRVRTCEETEDMANKQIVQERYNDKH